MEDNPDVTNTTTSRTREAIALGPTGNIQGTQKVFCLETGKVLKQRKIIPLPVPDRVIQKVEQWGKRSQRESYGTKIELLNRNMKKYDWDNDDLQEEEGLVEEIKEVAHPDLPAEMPGIDIEEEQPEAGPAVEEVEMSESELAAAAARNASIEMGAEPQTIVDETDVPDDDDHVVYEIDEDSVEDMFADVKQEPVQQPGVLEQGVARAIDQPPELMEPDSSDDEDSDEEDEDEQSEVQRRSQRRRYPARKREKTKTYVPSMTGKKYEEGVINVNVEKVQSGVIHVNVQDTKLPEMTKEERMEHVLGVILLQQFNLNAGLKKFGVRGEQAVSKELKQLHDMRTFSPVDAQTLSKEEQIKALSLLMFLTEKRDGNIKGQACADG